MKCTSSSPFGLPAGQDPELKLRAAGLNASLERALDALSRLTATEHTWQEQALVVQASQPDAEVEKILSALGISLRNPVLRVTGPQPPEQRLELAL